MNLLRSAMAVYQYVFHPGLVLAGTLLLLVYREWAADPTGRRRLAVRVGQLLGAYVVAVVPLALYLLVRRPSVTRLTAGTDWPVNLVTAASLLLGGGLARYLWSRKPRGSEVAGAGLAVLVTAVPYALLAPLWNVSGHVTFTTVPALYLALVDRAYLPLLVVPLVMVFNRPFLGAHTWFQSVAGLALGTLGVLAARGYSSVCKSLRKLARIRT